MRISTLLLFALFGLLQYTLFFGDAGLLQYRIYQKEAEIAKAENIALQDDNEALTNEVRDLKKGLRSVEARARTDLGMIKKGETFVYTIEPS